MITLIERPRCIGRNSALGARTYRPHIVNFCPDCGHAQWNVGRVVASYVFCEAPLQISGVTITPPSNFPEPKGS